MNKVTRCAALLCMTLTSAQAQQIASLDLSRTPKSNAHIDKLSAVPKGCELLLGSSVADGVALLPTPGRPDIEVRIVKVSDENPVLGAEVQADVQVRNVGQYAIQVPWSLDPDTMTNGQDASNLEWEEAGINLYWAPHDLLRNLSAFLFGSRFSEGTELTIHPGEWVTLTVKFRAALAFNPPPLPNPEISPPRRLVSTGLFAQWDHARRTRVIRDCVETIGWFSYEGSYRQQNPTTPFHIQ